MKRLFTKFTTTFCCCPLRSYSSFRLVSTIAATTTSWTFLPCQSRRMNAVMISLMWQNQICRDPRKVVLHVSLQTLPPRANTESDQCCGMEWGWFARLGRKGLGTCLHSSCPHRIQLRVICGDATYTITINPLLARPEAIILQSFPIILLCTSQNFLPLFFQLYLLFCRTFQFRHRKSHKTYYWHTYNKTRHISTWTSACWGSWLAISRLSSLRCWICWWHVDW